MASASASLSEDQFICSICLDVFSQAVTIPCGHNFCKACISKYWDSNDFCHCPMCKKSFEARPDLFVNTLISEMAAQFRKSTELNPPSSNSLQQDSAGPVEVSCDVCIGTKLKAVKSCLVCLASYCETHLEPHQKAAALMKHKLIEPEENLEDRLCKAHSKMLELFCRSDQVCVCVMCLQMDHKGHDVVLLEEEYKEKQVQLSSGKTKVQQKVKERQKKIQQIRRSVEQSVTAADAEIAEGVQVFAALVASIQRNQADFIEAIELRKRAVEQQAEGFIKELEQEISKLQERSGELRQLSLTEDHLRFLQSFPSTSDPPQVRDWSGVNVRSDASVGAVRTAVAQLEAKLDKEMEKLPEVKLKRARQQYAVDVTLDPDTAHPDLILSEDGKQVRLGDLRKILPYNPKRFDFVCVVLGKEGFSSGRFYFEVQVKGNTNWSLGVARESIRRKGEIDPKFWLLRLREGKNYSARDASVIPLCPRMKPQKIGVFVDYEGGQISFYDVETRSLLYLFKGCNFAEKLYPIFGSYSADDDKNAAPLIITSVY